MRRLIPLIGLICSLGITSIAQAQETAAPPLPPPIRPSQPIETGFLPDRLAPLDERFERLIEDEKFAGAVVVLARGHAPPVVRAYGRRGPGSPMREDTIFRIYSMTKPITAVAALILVDDGKLKLDEPLTRYLPEMERLTVHRKTQNGGKPDRLPTVKDLLTQTGGFSYGFGRGAVDRQYRQKGVLGSKDLGEMTAKTASIPLAYEPGARWHYSVAKDLLGRVVEVASEQSLDGFMQARIFDPLGMVDTGFHVPDDKIERFSMNYGPRPGGGLRIIDGTRRSRYARPATLFSGGGGLVSTASDYLRFCRMLLNGGELDGMRILEEETVAAMTSNQLPDELVPIRMGAAPMPGTGFGLGVSVRVAESPPAEQGEYGWGGAASTSFAISPASELIVITMTQRMPFSAEPITIAKPIAYDALERGGDSAPETDTDTDADTGPGTETK